MSSLALATRQAGAAPPARPTRLAPRRVAGLIAGLVAVVAPGGALAHEVLHEVRAGGAVAVRAYHADGEPLAGATFLVWSPTDAGRPWQKGRTDREGWLSFVPASPGRWRVKVVEGTGHGIEVVVDTATLAAAAPPAPGPPPATAATTTPEPPAPPAATPALPGAAFVLRPLLGVLLIAALFGGLVLLYRRKGPR